MTHIHHQFEYCLNTNMQNLDNNNIHVLYMFPPCETLYHFEFLIVLPISMIRIIAWKKFVAWFRFQFTGDSLISTIHFTNCFIKANTLLIRNDSFTNTLNRLIYTSCHQCFIHKNQSPFI